MSSNERDHPTLTSSDAIIHSTADRNFAQGCPYAQVLQRQNSSNGNDDFSSFSSDSSSSTLPSEPPMVSLYKECPAFAHSCPFKNCSSSDEVSQVFTKMLPRSHIDQARPMSTVLIDTIANFHRDMESLSLGAIISKQVQERQEIERVENEDDLDGSTSSHSNENDNKARKEKELNVPAVAAVAAEERPKSRRQSRRLSDALKYGTEEAHQEAESVHFVKNFIRGKIDRDLYGLFVAQLFHVYKQLECSLDEYAETHFPDCHFPVELKRNSALQDDIDFWGNGTIPPISPATRDYIDRIEAIAKERPVLLLAHAYTRYLGDLSGGKILARVAKRALMLDSGSNGLTEGLAFYDFPLLQGSVKAFKDQYRQALNDLDFDEGVIQAIVAEANVAFLLNMRLFEELDVIGSVPGSKVRPLEEVYSNATSFSASYSIPSTQNEEGTEKTTTTAPCPFLNSSSSSAGTSITQVNQLRSHNHSAKTCPWPFILLHDPNAGMGKWQTWVSIGLVLAYLYQYCLISL